MDINDLPKPSPKAVGISTLVLALLGGVIGGAWFYREQSTSKAKQLKRQANRKLKRVRGQFQEDSLSSTAKTGLAIGVVGLLVGLVFGGNEVYKRTHDK